MSTEKPQVSLPIPTHSGPTRSWCVGLSSPVSKPVAVTLEAGNSQEATASALRHLEAITGSNLPNSAFSVKAYEIFPRMFIRDVCPQAKAEDSAEVVRSQCPFASDSDNPECLKCQRCGHTVNRKSQDRSEAIWFNFIESYMRNVLKTIGGFLSTGSEK